MTRSEMLQESFDFNIEAIPGFASQLREMADDWMEIYESASPESDKIEKIFDLGLEQGIIED